MNQSDRIYSRGITLQKLLMNKELSRCQTLCGAEGLSRTVSAVDVLGSQDSLTDIQEGEILIDLHGTALKRICENADFLTELSKSGAAALFINFWYSREKLCADICEKANELAFPIIAVPSEGSLLKVIIPVLEWIIGKEMENKYRDLFLKDLLLHHIRSRDEIASRMQLYDWRLTKDSKILLLAISDNNAGSTISPARKERNQRILREAEEIVQQQFPTTEASFFPDYGVYIIEQTVDFRKELKLIGKKLLQLASAKYGCTACFCASSMKTSILEIRQGYEEALEVFQIVQRFHLGSGIYFYKDMQIYHLLNRISKDEYSLMFSRNTLKPLLDYDLQRRGVLLKTLIAIVDSDWNLKHVSVKMYTHYNTIKYRYHKIEEILGVDLNHTARRMELQLAVMIYRICGEV